MTTASTIPEVARLELQPFRRRIRECRKCGGREWQLPSFLVYLLKLRSTAFEIAYCPGGRDPQQTAAVATPFGAQEIEYTMLCAGIHVEHQHVKCRRCGYVFFMHVQWPLRVSWPPAAPPTNPSTPQKESGHARSGGYPLA